MTTAPDPDPEPDHAFFAVRGAGAALWVVLSAVVGWIVYCVISSLPGGGRQ